MKYRCLIIDHDDTAVNSTARIHYPAHLEVLNRMRPGVSPITLDEWFLKNFHPGIMEYLKNELGMNNEELEAEYRIWRTFTTTRVPEFYPGFIETMQEYRNLGGKIAVVSHSEKNLIERDYRSLEPGIRFMPDLIHGWDYDETKRKPHPYPVFEILKSFELKSEHTLILDDLKPGVVMAKAAGLHAAAAGWGHKIPEIRAYMKKYCIAYFETVEEFADFILR
jgi:beta-phosphoglucomutase-like phosphatase (HAD superfamily)